MTIDYLPAEDVEDNTFYRLQKKKVKVNCEHHFWTVKCSVCGKVLGSESNILELIKKHNAGHI